MRVEAVIATTHAIPAYGGIQMPIHVLEHLADQLRSGDIPMQVNHNITRLLSPVVIDAGVRSRSDGEAEVWALYDLPRNEWQAWQDELSNSNSPGGMSISFGVTILRTSDTPIVVVAADASQFDDQEIVEISRVLEELGTIEAKRLYELASAPIAKILLTISEHIGLDMLSTILWESIRRVFKRRGKQHGNTVLEIKMKVNSKGSYFRARLETDSEEVARDAIIKLGGLSAHAGIVNFDSTISEWSWVADDPDELN